MLLRRPLQAHLHLQGVGGLRIALVGRPLVQLLVRQAQHCQPAAMVCSVSLTREGLPRCLSCPAHCLRGTRVCREALSPDSALSSKEAQESV